MPGLWRYDYDMRCMFSSDRDHKGTRVTNLFTYWAARDAYVGPSGPGEEQADYKQSSQSELQHCAILYCGRQCIDHKDVCEDVTVSVNPCVFLAVLKLMPK